jgi:hypothetical protein
MAAGSLLLSWLRGMNLSAKGGVIAAAPAMAMLLVYYSLAIHMHQALGGWPASIGERGFPAPLILHAKIDMYFCVGLIWSIMFVLPLAVIVCAVVNRWRRFLPYLGVYFMSCILAAGLMQLAPAPFLYWWWD